METIGHGTGFWGKIPSRGDFVGRGVSGDLSRAWHGWVELVAADPIGQKLFDDDGWEAGQGGYLTMAAGLCGPSPCCGAWLPAEDAVGRRFMLLLAAEGAGSAALWPDDAWAAWLRALLAAGRDAMARRLSPDAFWDFLPAPPGRLPTATRDGVFFWRAGEIGEDGRLATPSYHDLAKLPDAAALARLMEASLP